MPIYPTILMSESTPKPSPLKVQPPRSKAAPQQPAAQPQKTVSDPPTSLTTPVFEVSRWITIAGVFTALTAASFIPVSNDVIADGILEPPSTRPVFMEVPGTVVEFLVETGDRITPNTPIARVSTLELEDEILATEQQLQEQQRQLDQLEQQVPVLEGRMYETQMAGDAIANQASRINQRLTGEPPAIGQLRQQQAALQDNISGLRTEIAHLEDRESTVRAAIKRLRAVWAKPGGRGVLSISEIDRKDSELSLILSEKERKINEITTIQRQIDGKAAEIAAMRHDWQDELGTSRDRWQQSRASMITAQRELAAAHSELAHLRGLVQTSQHKLQTLQERRDRNQTLISTESGMVLSTDLSEKLGRKMQANESIMEIANIDTLDVVIEVPQVDTPMVVPGAIVKIRFHETGHSVYETVIQEIDPQLKTDETGQQRLTARAQLQNPDHDLLPNQKIHAQILGEKIPLYQKIRLEIRKHLNWTRYGFGE